MIINEEVRGWNPLNKRSETSKIYIRTMHNNISLNQLVYESEFLEGRKKTENLRGVKRNDQ